MNDNQLATPGIASAFTLLSIYGNAINVCKAPAGSTTFSPLMLNGVDVVVSESFDPGKSSRISKGKEQYAKYYFPQLLQASS